jgi:hypothetical protein
LKNEIYREYVHGGEILLIEAVVVHPGEFLALWEMIV